MGLNILSHRSLLRLFGPGVIRLILAALVMFSHMSRFQVGRIGVLLFFFLSGYWVSRLWASDRHVGRFFAGRLLRIMPLYWLVLFIAAYIRHQQILPQNIMLIGGRSRGNDPLNVSWSLEVELEFYALLPLLALLTGGQYLVVSFLVAMAAIIWAPMTTAANFLPAFALGAIVFKQDYKPSGMVAALSAFAFIVVTAVIMVSPLHEFITVKSMHGLMRVDIFSFFWMLPVLPFVAWSLRMKSDRLDRHIGNLSYPLYLVHFSVIAMVADRSLQGKALSIALAVLISLTVYALFDLPLERFRHSIVKRIGGGRGAKAALS